MTNLKDIKRWVGLIPALAEGGSIQFEKRAVADGKLDVAPDLGPDAVIISEAKRWRPEPDEVEVADDLRPVVLKQRELIVKVRVQERRQRRLCFAFRRRCRAADW